MRARSIQSSGRTFSSGQTRGQPPSQLRALPRRLARRLPRASGVERGSERARRAIPLSTKPQRLTCTDAKPGQFLSKKGHTLLAVEFGIVRVPFPSSSSFGLRRPAPARQFAPQPRWTFSSRHKVRWTGRTIRGDKRGAGARTVSAQRLLPARWTLRCRRAALLAHTPPRPPSSS
jgi:hypothetical protein